MNAKELGAQPVAPMIGTIPRPVAPMIGTIPRHKLDHGPWDDTFTHHGGLTKRELFAAMAMQGMISDSGIYGASTKLADKKGIDVTAVVADAAVCFADAILAELAKDQP